MAKTKKYSVPVHFENIKHRMLIVAVMFSVYGAILVVRLVSLQVFQHETLQAQSEKQYVRKIKINSGRGIIFDRNHNALAANIEVESVYVDPREIENKNLTADGLSTALGIDKRIIVKNISANKPFVWIKRKCSFKEIESLKKLDLPGVGYVGETKRFYPKRELAASVIGFVGLDNQGLAGIEHKFHSSLKGISYKKVMVKDARGRIVRAGTETNDIQGNSKDIELTIDEVIQFITERELNKQIQKYNAKGGIAIVMDPNQGEILAMADLPEFNPNNFSAYPEKYYKNKAVTNVYDPGSIFKPIVAAAALDLGLAEVEETFFGENGDIKIGKVHIGEASDHRFGWLTLRNIISKSSNIGIIKVAQRIGEKNLFNYIQQFGFGKKLGIDLPGEANGKLRDLSKWDPLSLASVSFGHEISITPLQMTVAMGAIANGGYLVRPRVVQGILKDGQRQHRKPLDIKRILSEQTSRKMISILKTVVKDGTGKNAAIQGYDVAGKTGTAQKLDPETKAYSQTAYISSFIGFVPADDPKLVILVMLDEPQGVYWGGEVAAPAFSAIGQQVLRYINVPSNDEHIFVLNKV